MELYDLFDGTSISPQKIFYKIGEVSKILGVRPSVLRYWESEFKCHTPKSKSNQRVYEKKDIIAFLEIKRLLYDERFTIEGAKKQLKELKKTSSQKAKIPEQSMLQPLGKDFLKKIKNELSLIAKELDDTSDAG